VLSREPDGYLNSALAMVLPSARPRVRRALWAGAPSRSVLRS
jgi:hypothetical protein